MSVACIKEVSSYLFRYYNEQAVNVVDSDTVFGKYQKLRVHYKL